MKKKEMNRLKTSKSSLTTGKTFGGWLKSNPKVDKIELNESIMMTNKTQKNEASQHPFIDFLSKHKLLTKYITQYKAIVLLPMREIIQDLPCTSTLIETHCIFLSPKTMEFITLNGLTGNVDGQKINMYHDDSIVTNHKIDILGKKLEALTEKENKVVEFSTQICAIHEIQMDKNTLITFSIKYPLTVAELPWSWKTKQIQLKVPPQTSLYKLAIALERSFITIRSSIPKLIEEEKENGEENKYFVADINEQRLKLLQTNDLELIKFHSLISINCNTSFETTIRKFLIDFPVLVNGKTLKERNEVLTCFLTDMADKAADDVIWRDENNVFDKKNFMTNMRIFLVNKLYRYLWPPSIDQIEHQENTDWIVLDSMLHYTSSTYLLLQPHHLGVEGQHDCIPIILKEVRSFLRKMDMVRSPVEKIMCIFCALKIVEQTCYYLKIKHNIENKFNELLLYCIIQADLEHISSSILYIKEIGENVDPLLKMYFEKFEKSCEILTKLNHNIPKEMKEEVRILTNLRIDEINWSIYQNHLPDILLPTFTISDLHKYFGVFPLPTDNIRKLIYTNSIQVTRDDVVDLMTIMKFLQQN